jgi:hypothetical protein
MMRVLRAVPVTRVDYVEKAFLDAGLEDPTKYQNGISPKI